MIGHRTERHGAFGWASARLDDVLNWVPARLTGVLFCLVGGGKQAWQVMVRDAGQHRSPQRGSSREGPSPNELSVAVRTPPTMAVFQSASFQVAKRSLRRAQVS